MAKHKPGAIINVDNISMILPNVGNLVDCLIDGEQYVARIIGVNVDGTKIKIVSKDTKE